MVHQENDTNWVKVALSLLCLSIYLCFRYFNRFRTLSCNFHPASPNFPPSIPPIFLNFPPSINPLLHALKIELFFPPRVCSSATHLFVHFQKYMRTPKQYSSTQQRILAWTNSSHRARRHVWCWVEFHPHHYWGMNWPYPYAVWLAAYDKCHTQHAIHAIATRYKVCFIQYGWYTPITVRVSFHAYCNGDYFSENILTLKNPASNTPWPCDPVKTLLVFQSIGLLVLETINSPSAASHD